MDTDHDADAVVAPTADPDVGPAPARPPATTDAPTRRGVAWLPWVIAGLAIAVAVASTVLWLRADARADDLAAAEQDRTEVGLVANSFLVALTTWDAVDLDATLQQIEELGTQRLREDVAELLGLEINQQLRDLNVRSDGDVLDVFVQSLANGRAEVFAVVRQSVESDRLEETEVTFNYFDLRFLETPDGEWLADAVVLIDPALGPPPLLLGEG